MPLIKSTPASTIYKLSNVPKRLLHQLRYHSSIRMPSYIVTLKENVSPEELKTAKETAVDQGGSITHEFTLIKAFTVEYPEGHTSILSSNDKVSVEQDGEVKTQ